MRVFAKRRERGGGVKFHGSIVALVTPFKNGEVDEKTLVKLVRRQIEAGTDGLVPTMRPSSFDTYWLSSGIHYFGFGSWHTNETCNFALSDGASRSIAKNIDFKILKALATREGNERVPEY